MKVKLAEALLRRKELQAKVDQIKQVQQNNLFEIKMKRQKVTEDIDDIVASVPKVTLSQVTAEYDFYARSLRLVDAAIQQANWTAEVEVDDKTMSAYSA
jgi:hypothetical protein